MESSQFDELVKDVVEIAAISYSKVAHLSEEDFTSLKRILTKEIVLGFKHELVVK